MPRVVPDRPGCPGSSRRPTAIRELASERGKVEGICAICARWFKLTRADVCHPHLVPIDMTLPDCPACDAVRTREAIRGDGATIWCTCTCCSKVCAVKGGRVVHPPSVLDVKGVQMHEP